MQSAKKILVVEDNASIRKVLEAWLRVDYDVYTAGTGEEALELAVEERPEVILLDIVMPGINGYETCRRIRSIQSLGHTKILMVSGNDDVSERIEAYQTGADDYITKPVNREELLAKIRVYLRLKSVEEVDQLKSSALTLLSHNARTPLNGMLNSAEMLMSDEPMDCIERKEWAELIFSSAKRLQKYFDNVMTLCNMKIGEWDYQYTQGDMREITNSVIDDYASHLSERNIKIEHSHQACPAVGIDLQEMKRVVDIVLDNAIRFTPDGGVINIDLFCNNGDVCLRIADQGPGIDKDFLPNIFQEISSTDSETHPDQNKGISLAIVKQILSAHKGKILAENQNESGAAFTISLPGNSIAEVVTETH